MTDLDNGRADSPDGYKAKHAPSRRNRLRNDPDYGDYMYEQEKDRKMEEAE